jgi:exosortase O
MRVSIRLDPLALTGKGTTYILIAAWLYANISSLKWLFALFKQASPLHLLLIGLIVVVLVVRVVRSRRHEGFESHSYLLSAVPVVRSLPLLLMVGSALCAIAFQWLVDIEQFIVLLFLLGTYGLCGLFLAPSVWRKGLPIASLLACIVPFSSQVGTGLGMPARVFTAHAVEHLLSAWHVAALSSYDIIILENGAARVDIPCSGLRSLWTGTIFLLAATWLEGRKLGLRWLLVCVSNLFFLLCANTTRVLLLVVITYVLKQPLIAQMLHIPLGLIGLCCACGLSWMMLQTVPRYEKAEVAGRAKAGKKLQVARGDVFSTDNFQGQSSSNSPACNKAQPALLPFVIALALISQLYHPQEEQPLSITSLHWPTQMVSERISLSAAEHKYFDNYPYLFPEKRRFVLGDLSGSILVVANTTLGTYHPPELCLLGTGFKVDRMETKRLTPTVQARWLSLGNSKLSATYWFQSPTQTTDDFLSRFWSDITRRQKNWVLVSVLFDRSVRPDSSEIREFATTIHHAINHSLKKG